MNVLMLSLADSVFRPSEKTGNTLDRQLEYFEAMQLAAPGSALTVLVFTRESFSTLTPRDGLTFIPVRAPRVQFFPLLGLLAAFRARRHFHPDVVTTQNPFEAGLLGLLLAQAFGARLEVQIHFDLLSPYWLQERRAWNPVRLWLAGRILPRADAIRVVSSPVSARVRKRWRIPGEHITTIPVPVAFETDPESEELEVRCRVLADPSSKLVLFVGRLCYQKNLPGLFAVIEGVLDSRPDTESVLVGDGPERAYVAARAAALDTNRIHVMGNVPYHEIPQYYEAADVLILPSLYEGFGRVVLEGYLFGTPAVATRCGGPEDIIRDGETGFLTSIQDMEGFSDRVLWLLDHPGVARDMGHRGTELVQREFAPQKLISKVIGQLKRLAAGGTMR